MVRAEVKKINTLFVALLEFWRRMRRLKNELLIHAIRTAIKSTDSRFTIVNKRKPKFRIYFYYKGLLKTQQRDKDQK